LRSKRGLRESWEKAEKKGAFQQQKQPRECMLLSLSYSGELIHSNHSALSEKKAAL
jgi:fatty-acid desaturase